jgi:PBSX family phage terminase large subunit
VFLLWQQGASGKWYCIDEYYYSGRDETKQKTDKEYSDDLQDFIGNRKIEAVIVDPSAASFIAELRERGLKVRKARNDVLDGIRFTGTMLNMGKIAFLKKCENTIKEFASYVWDVKACERGEDKPMKQNDHAMDAVRYFCFTILYRPQAKLKTFKGGV